MAKPEWMPDFRDADAYPRPPPKKPKVWPSPVEGLEVPPAHKGLEADSRIQWKWEFVRRMKDYQDAWENRRTTPVAAILARYGMRTMVDPANSKASARAFVPRPTAHAEYSLNADKLMAMADDGYLIAAIDLRATKEEIKETVWALVSAVRHESGEGRTVKLHPDLWPQYLRILDGVASGASWPEIADVLSTESDTLSDGVIGKRLAKATKLATSL